MSGLDCCPFFIITVLHLLPTEHGSSSIGAVVGSPLSADSAGKSASSKSENDGVCGPASHTSINTDKCKLGRHCSGVITTDGDLLPHKTCGRDGG